MIKKEREKSEWKVMKEKKNTSETKKRERIERENKNSLEGEVLGVERENIRKQRLPNMEFRNSSAALT